MTMKTPRLLALVVVAALAAACAPQSQSTEEEAGYPSRAIELVVPFDAGGATDIAARLLADSISNKLDQPVNVVNRPGADQITGVQSVVNATPDGYTLLADGAGSSSLQSLLDNLPFAWDDRSFVVRALVGPHAYAVGNDSNAADLEGLVAEIKKDPGSYRVAWLGGSTTSDYALLQLMDEAGIDPESVKRIPFESSGDAMTAAAAGDVDLAVGGVSATFSLADSGKLRVLAVTSQDRVEQLPDVPTTEEAGMPALDITYWVGLSAPPGLSDGTTATLVDTVRGVVDSDEFAAKAQKIAMTPEVMDGEEFRTFVHDEAATFQDLSEQLDDSN